MQGKVDEGFWETNELLIATVLVCYGIDPIELYYDPNANSTYWRFHNTPQLGTTVAQFALDRCRVEPKKFNSTYVGLKDEMFDFMRDQGARPRARARQ